MSALLLDDPPAEVPARQLRRTAAAVRVHFTWWGVHRTLTAQQNEEVGDACGADARLLSAGKKILTCGTTRSADSTPFGPGSPVIGTGLLCLTWSPASG